MNRLFLTVTVALGALSLVAQTPATSPTQVQPAPVIPAAPVVPPSTTPPAETPPAADGKPAQDSPKPKKPAAPAAPTFRGKVESTDTTAMTVTVAGKEKQRVFHVTSKTRFEKAGKPAVFADVQAGEEIRGSYAHTADGDNLVRASVGGPAEKKDKKEPGPTKPKHPKKPEHSVDHPAEPASAK